MSEQLERKHSLLHEITITGGIILFMLGIIFAGFYAFELSDYLTGSKKETANVQQVKVPTDQLPSAPDDKNLTVRSELACWLRADALSNITDGTQVVMLLDGSGKKVHARQNNPANAPTYVSQGIGGKPTLRFDGADDFLFVGNITQKETPATVYVVWDKPQAGGQPFQRILSSSGKGLDYQTGGIAFVVPTAENGTQKSNGPTITRFNLAKVDLQFFTLGRLNAQQVQFLAGDIAEVLVYTKALSAEEQAKVDEYLTKKYGIASITKN